MILLLLGCATRLDNDDICQEVGYAIAGRTEACTGDSDLAESRYTSFEENYSCVDVDPSDSAGVGGVRPEDLFACPLAIRNLACELVEDYDDDLEAWMRASPVCALLVEER